MRDSASRLFHKDVVARCIKPCLKCGGHPEIQSEDDMYGKFLSLMIYCDTCDIQLQLKNSNHNFREEIQKLRYDMAATLIRDWNHVMTEPNFTTAVLEGKIQ